MKQVIIRSNESGVWYGTLAAHADDHSWVTLKKATRLWRWQTKEGVSCSALAVYGVDAARSQLAPVVSEVIVTGVCEIIAVDKKAEKTYVG